MKLRSYFVSTFVLLMSCNQEQAPDLTFDTTVKDPVYRTTHPKVLFDEAHNNFHTSTGRYAPFANLITNDGYEIAPNSEPFTAGRLKLFPVLVISNARGPMEGKYKPAFTESECNAVRDWVLEGGSLLLIADHYPMGFAAQDLSRRFGVTMGGGYASDSLHYQGSAQYKDELVFSAANGFLGSHPIVSGRNDRERINVVITFTGQTLKGPDSATVLLKLSDDAEELIPDSVWDADGKTYTRFPDLPSPAPGTCQGLAMAFGKGRIVILGEAAMMTAQVADGKKFGMNVPGNDNKQFALNVMHWLSRSL